MTDLSPNALRQERWRLRQLELGLVPCTVYIPSGHIAVFREAAEKIRENRDLTIGPMLNTKTGRLVGKTKKGNTNGQA